METLSNGLSIAVEIEPATDVTRALFDGLSQSNVERTGDGKIEHVCVIARDSGSTLMGGIYGEIYWGWLNILALWVTPQLRRRGLGTQLLSRAEAEALPKGCHGAYLDVHLSGRWPLYTCRVRNIRYA